MRLFGRRQGLLLGAAGALAAVGLVVLPVAPRMGSAVQSDVCDAFGSCRTAELMTDACHADTRSAVSGQASTPVYFEQPAPGSVGLRFFADGTAGVVVDEEDAASSHRFPTGEAALRWLVGRNPAETSAVDRVWGPAARGQAEAVLNGFDALGLGQQSRAAESSTVVRGDVGDERALLAVAEDGAYSVHQTVRMPIDRSARLTGLTAWMGLQAHMVVRTDHTATGTPTSVTFTGPKRTGWDLRVLNGTEPTTRRPGTDVPGKDEFSLRSFTLDLTREQNAHAFAGVYTARQHLGGKPFSSPPVSAYPTEGDADGKRAVHPVDVFADRVRSDAVLVESSYEGPADGSGALTVDAVLALLTGAPLEVGPVPTAVAGSGSAGGSDTDPDPDDVEFAPRLVDASAMDLARPESDLSPLVNCDVVDAEELQELVDDAEA
ncbi:MAG: hypothetical protein ACTHVY_08405 [Brevibacterium yomogidense]